MIIKHEHNNIHFTKNGKVSKNGRNAKSKFEIKCDKCNKVFFEEASVFKKRLKLINKEYCGKCSRPLMSKLAGIKSAYNSDGTLKFNKGHFSTERVEQLSDDEYKKYCLQRKKL